MTKKLSVILMLFLFVGCAGWKINGVTKEDFKNRSWKKIGVGAISSFAIHELGHLTYASLNGGGHIDFDEKVIIMDDYYNRSHSTQQMFHRAGFLSQLLVGGILTAIPKTRHSDFTLGFNAFTFVNTAIYTTVGGEEKKYSDIENLDNGVQEGSLYTLGSGILTFINISKEE